MNLRKLEVGIVPEDLTGGVNLIELRIVAAPPERGYREVEVKKASRQVP